MDKNYSPSISRILDFWDDVMQPAHDVIGYRHMPKTMDAQPTVECRMKKAIQVIGSRCRKAGSLSRLFICDQSHKKDDVIDSGNL